MISKKLSSACGVGLVVLTIAFLLSSDSDVANAAHSAPSIPAAVFPADAGTLGGIPDHVAGCDATGGTPRNVTFTVSGLSGAPTNVEASVTFGGPAHSWVGDVEAVLIAPNGASHTLFARTLATTATSCGDSTDATGSYTFADSAAAPPNGGWWQTANILGAAVPMTIGSYRTTAIGGAGAPNPQPPTNMNAAFAGVANPNGTWTLRISDHGGGDTGAVSAASLTIDAAIVDPGSANVDLNGDGRTDYTVARGTTTPLAPEGAGLRPGRANYSGLDKRPDRTQEVPASAVPDAPPIFWYTLFNNSATTRVDQIGDAATDFIVPEDFDGDGKTDLAVWNPASVGGATFQIFLSATNTVNVQLFGQDGDDPAVVGDYDGDGKADVAVFRCPGFADPDGQCFYFYRGSLNNPSGNITYVPWGFGVDGDFFPYVGDFDGDGKNDFCIQRANPSAPASGQFVLLRSADFGVEFINWGLSSDFLIPGDYDGDGKTDLAVRRSNTPSAGLRSYFVLYRTGATNQVQFGITGDVSAPGDYDGDGKTDFAIWRGSATPSENGFWVLNSSNGSSSFQRWGQCATVATCDFAVAGWAVH